MRDLALAATAPLVTFPVECDEGWLYVSPITSDYEVERYGTHKPLYTPRLRVTSDRPDGEKGWVIHPNGRRYRIDVREKRYAVNRWSSDIWHGETVIWFYDRPVKSGTDTWRDLLWLSGEAAEWAAEQCPQLVHESVRMGLEARKHAIESGKLRYALDEVVKWRAYIDEIDTHLTEGTYVDLV